MGRSNEANTEHEYEPPVLPPRPRTSNNETSAVSAGSLSTGNCGTCSRKYVFLCSACGGISIILGSLFSALYFVLRSYTSSLHYFETVPSYVASIVLIIMGLLMLCFGWRRNRFGYLVKLCGACSLVCAIVCVVITVTTTVVHMNRLQSLRECIYNTRGHSCTCFTRTGLGSNFMEAINEEGAAQYIFADTPDCEVVHGALYACLRGLFGLSVIGILVSLFSGMLIYQLLGHERKKMYWEQLELRSRAMFQRNHAGPCCGCCQHCRIPLPPRSNVFPWTTLDVLNDNGSRYWNLHGGNLYSPGPCSNVGPSNFPAASHVPRSCNSESSGSPRRNPPWNWLPWRPSNAETSSQENNERRCERTSESRNSVTAIGPDDHYGFPLSGNGNYRPPLAVAVSPSRAYPASSGGETVSSWGPPPPYSRATNSDSGSFSLSGNREAARKAPAAGSGSEKCPAASSSLASRNSSKSDPRRMPWTLQDSQRLVGPNPKSKTQTSGNVGDLAKNDKEKSDRESSELYFADTSSYTVSVHNDGGNESATYEEISHSLRVNPQVRGPGRNPRNPHPLGEDKMFSPIVVARNENPRKSRWPLEGNGLSAFGPYRRSVPLPAERKVNELPSPSEFYENLGRLKQSIPATDLDDGGNLSPDDEVAILTSQFVEDLDLNASLSDSDSVVRAVHV